MARARWRDSVVEETDSIETQAAHPGRRRRPALEKPRNIDFESEIEAAAAAGKKRAAAEAATAQAAPRKLPAKPAARPEPGTLTAEDMAAMGFDPADMDDYDRLEVESQRAERTERRTGTFTPDRPASLRDAGATNFEQAKALFRRHGYRLPRVVFWNVQSRNQQQPVRCNAQGVALVSGCTARIFSQVMSGELDPYRNMMAVLGSERYAAIQAG